MSDPSSPLTRFQLWRDMLPPALRVLLTLNVATYIVFVALSIVRQGALLQWLALPADLQMLARQPWSVLTWGVTNLEPGLFRLIFFGFGLAWLSLLGRDIEADGGPHRLVGLYVFGTLGGAALAAAAGALLPAGISGGLYSGIWGPLLALLCYTAVLHPDRPIGLMFIGAVALKWIAIVLVVLELAFQQDPSHLGAALAGALFALAERRDIDLAAWARPLFRTASGRRSEPARTSRTSRTAPEPTRTAGRAPRPERPTPLNVDAVLDKINEKGIDSLTDEERRVLDRAGRG